jgi:hypothetical protein
MDHHVAEGFHGYSRTELDAFLLSVEDERARLEAAIAEDEVRTRAARAALGTHRVMVSMLLQAQREIDEIRARAEAEAAVVLLASSSPSAPVLDITRLEHGVPSPMFSTRLSPATNDDNTEYFDFLRGALVDDAPLGPRPESA